MARQGQRTYRQLDYWARTGLVEPTLRGAHGSGSQRDVDIDWIEAVANGESPD